ncbi:MAG: PhzF family phenazine biosynthesis protein [Parasphingorhabdus sp.]
MQVPIYVVDAFTGNRFSGNSAAVVLFDSYPEDALLQKIAAENNLAETVYPLLRSDGNWEIRWFTPTVEVPLCGHATLASAHVLFNHIVPEASQIEFVTRYSGNLVVQRQGDTFIMDFPAKELMPSSDDLSSLIEFQPQEVLKCDQFIMAVMSEAVMVKDFRTDRSKILELDCDGLIITAPGEDGYDCISRFFTPAQGIDEDPVTGGAHTMIAPYWIERLRLSEIKAYQASERGGEMICRLKGSRVELEGSCVDYLSGMIEV